MSNRYLIVAIISIFALIIAAVGFSQKGSGENLMTSPNIQTASDSVKLQIQNLGINEVASPTPVQQGATATPKVRRQMQQPTMQIDKNKSYTATLHTTAGDIVISLNAAETPITANNFVALAKSNFYDNTIFHRAIKGFMIQGGDPNGNGTGGPGYNFDDEPFKGEYTRGTVAMANAGPDTNGSQFFIMHADYPLPPNYVIFGKVTKGLDVVDKIATAPVKTSFSGEQSSPVSPVTVTSVEIAEK